MYKLELWVFKGSETHQFTGGANLISAVLVLALMILPTVINISESALRAVPSHLKSASLALGATKIQTIFQVVIPAAKSGIITAIVLGTGRAIGEAMAISLVSGSSVNVPLPFNSVRFLTTAIVSEMGYAAGLHRQSVHDDSHRHYGVCICKRNSKYQLVFFDYRYQYQKRNVRNPGKYCKYTLYCSADVADCHSNWSRGSHLFE